MLSDIRKLQEILATKPKEIKNPKLKDYGYGQIDVRASQIKHLTEKIRLESLEILQHNKKNPQKSVIALELAELSNDVMVNLDRIEILVQKVDIPKSGLKSFLSSIYK